MVRPMANVTQILSQINLVFQMIEVYYISPDLQYAKGTLGGLTSGDDAIVGGFRSNMKW